MTQDQLNHLAYEVESRDETKVGQAGDGLTVDCLPNPLDPTVVEKKNRTVCLMRPYENCYTCVHGKFTLIFKDASARSGVVACPRWPSPADRLAGLPPVEYQPTEVATCQSSPFEFCPSCPSAANVVRIGADKAAAGWYGRWHRLNREEPDDG